MTGFSNGYGVVRWARPAVPRPLAPQHDDPGNDRAVWAIRRDFNDDAHDFVCPRSHRAGAVRDAHREHLKWLLRWSWRPTMALVTISVHDFNWHAHRQGCLSQSCPPGPLAGPSVTTTPPAVAHRRGPEAGNR